jgi:hypothetical protein
MTNFVPACARSLPSPVYGAGSVRLSVNVTAPRTPDQGVRTPGALAKQDGGGDEDEETANRTRSITPW